jgi:hypothetical protein
MEEYKEGHEDEPVVPITITRVCINTAVNHIQAVFFSWADVVKMYNDLGRAVTATTTRSTGGEAAAA